MKWPIRNSSDEIDLITPGELETLPDGTHLRCIDGTWVIKGKDKIDDDTRAGFLAYGFPVNPDLVVAAIQEIVDEHG